MNYVNYKPIMEPKYYTKASLLGATTSPQTPNQIEQFTNLLNQGVVNIELETLDPQILDSIPNDHLTEINRLAKLTGSKPNMHAPIVDMSGFTQQGWSETQRKDSERILIDSIKRAHLLDPDGNIPVNIHGANTFGAEWDKSVEEEYKKVYKKGMIEVDKMPRVMAVVNQETGKVAPLEFEKKYVIGGEREEEIYDPYRRLSSMNESGWDQEKLKIMSYNKEINELRERQIQLMADIVSHTPEGKILPGDQGIVMNLNKEVNAIEGHIKNLNDINRSQFNDMHNSILRYGKDEEVKEYKEKIYPKIENEMKQVDSQIKELISQNKSIIESAENGDENARKKTMALQHEIERLKRSSIENMTKFVSEIPTPELWKPVNEFSKVKASDTIANAALATYKTFKDVDKMPIITIENSYPNMPLSRAEDLRELVETTRKKLVEKLIKEKVIKQKAEKIAEKLVGATWDVGHINMLKKGGYSDEDIIKESAKIAPYLKHLHITDNFGHNDTHLAPGMGNVPIQKILEQLKKEGASPDKVRQIVEAGGFVQHFKESPLPYILSEMGSPIYSLGGSPYWKSFKDIYSPYQMGYGDFLPSEHFKMYGSGFSGMPRELGGEAGGDKSRFSGAPNQ